MKEFLLNMWQKIDGITVLLEQGLVEYVAKIDDNALCGKSQW